MSGKNQAQTLKQLVFINESEIEKEMIYSKSEIDLEKIQQLVGQILWG